MGFKLSFRSWFWSWSWGKKRNPTANMGASLGLAFGKGLGTGVEMDADNIVNLFPSRCLSILLKPPTFIAFAIILISSTAKLNKLDIMY